MACPLAGRTIAAMTSTRTDDAERLAAETRLLAAQAARIEAENRLRYAQQHAADLRNPWKFYVFPVVLAVVCAALGFLIAR